MQHRGLRSSWMLHSVCWQSWIKQSKGNFTPGLTGCLKTAVTNYQPTLCVIPGEAKTSLFIMLTESLIHSIKIIITHDKKLVCYFWPSSDVQRNCFMPLILLTWHITWHDALVKFFTLKKKFLHSMKSVPCSNSSPSSQNKEWMNEWTGRKTRR